MRNCAFILAALIFSFSARGYADQAGERIPREGLLLWLDASTIELSDGAPLSLWTDQSDRANDVAQDDAALRPRLVRTAIGGRPAIQFGGDAMLDRSQFTGFAQGDQSFHMLFVIRAEQRESQPAQRLLAVNSRAAPAVNPEDRRGFWVGIRDSRSLPRFGIQNGDEGEARSACWDGRPHLLEVVYTGQQNFEMHVDGRRERRAMFNGTHFLGFQDTVSLALGQHFGQEPNAGSYYRGDIAEVLIYARPLSESERYAVGTSLSKKYSLRTHFRPLPQFERDVQPILATHCFNCHGRETQEAGLDLRTVSAMLRGGSAGPVIVRGHPDYSELIAKIESGSMPPDGAEPLSIEQQQLLRDWIEGDAPTSEKIELAVPASKVTAKDRAHWAFRMPVAHDPPQVKAVNRVRGEIDRFILSRLEEQGLTFSDDLPPAQLVRRVYFDLIGLPPSPAEVREFLAAANTGDAGLEQLIDRLLASEHFGERWGRHWLDVVGYVGVHGTDTDATPIKSHKGKWRYRDYVIRSFNRDKPFDQFLLEQLAGDELHAWRDAESFTPEILDSLTATTFLLSANDDSSQNVLNTPHIRHHVLQRTAENVANSLLAITLQCAKCHDHKYEAVAQYDYYRFQSVFAPIFNVRNWVTAEKRFRADISDHDKAGIDAHNAKIDAEVKPRSEQVNAIRDGYEMRLFDERLANLPQNQRAAVRAALQTPPEERNDRQQKLATEHVALNVTDADIDAALSTSDREHLALLRKQIAEWKSQRGQYGHIALATETPGQVVTHVLRRGNYLRPGLEVEAALPDILLPEGRAKRPLAARSVAKSSGRRLALGRALTDPTTLPGNHVARVFVNRIWQQLIGRGLVRTSDNFGVSGELPSHPELLDWLTIQFLEGGWRVKPIIRRILLSSTYRQTSSVGPESDLAARIDPGNRLLWRMNIRRLDSEQLRDSVLTVSGKLDRSIGGPPIPLDPQPDGMVIIKTDALPTPTSHLRRSVYIVARRNYHLTLMRVYDQPIVARTCSARDSTSVVTQALALLNSDFMLRQADYLAERVARETAKSSGARITMAYQLALGRDPDDDERALSAGLLQRQRGRFASSDETRENADQLALVQLCHTLLNTSEFVYLR